MAAKIEATEMLRPGLLAGVSVVLARETREAAWGRRVGLTATVPAACTGLGASVFECGLLVTGRIEADDVTSAESVAQALEELGEVSLLLVDSASSFAPGRGADGTSAEGQPSDGVGASALVGALEASWRVTQAVANAAFIERGVAGRIVYIAPPPDGGTHAEAARAGLENLARTLSVEWARYAITLVTIAPGEFTSSAEVAAVTAYLASPAGAYFSGCQLDLRGTAPGV
jgi:NAD(P)-dependent dehydrogenase (short-subunit alcohol dehydrogenase family)